MKKEITENEIKEYIAKRNDEIKYKLFYAVTTKDARTLHQVIEEIETLITLFVGALPKALAPFYKLILEATCSGMLIDDDDRSTYEHLKEKIHVQTVAIQAEANTLRGEGESNE